MPPVVFGGAANQATGFWSTVIGGNAVTSSLDYGWGSSLI